MFPLFVLLAASVTFNFALYKNIDQMKQQTKLNNNRQRTLRCVLMAIAVIMISKVP